MVYWKGDDFTTPVSNVGTLINEKILVFKYWTLENGNVDLFYANGTISFNQIN